MGQTKIWWEGLTAKEMPEYIRVGNRIYPIDDAISLGKMTKNCLPATKAEYEIFIKNQ